MSLEIEIDIGEQLHALRGYNEPCECGVTCARQKLRVCPFATIGASAGLMSTLVFIFRLTTEASDTDCPILRLRVRRQGYFVRHLRLFCPSAYTRAWKPGKSRGH